MIGSNQNGKAKPLPSGMSAADLLLSRGRSKEPKEIADLVDRMREDYQVTFAERILTASIKSAQVSVSVDGTNADDPRTDLLANHLMDLWWSTLRTMGDAIAYGRVAYEKEWEHSEAANLHYIRSLEQLPFRQTEMCLTDENDPAGPGHFDGIELKVSGSEGRYKIQASKSWWLAIDATALEPHGRSRYLGAPKKEAEKRQTIFDLQLIHFKKFCLRGGVWRGPEVKFDNEGQPVDYKSHVHMTLKQLTEGGTVYIPGDRDENGNYESEIEEPPSISDPAPIDAALDKSDARVLRAFGISELAVSQSGEVGSYALAVIHRLVLMAVVEEILQQFVESFQKYVVDKHVSANWVADEAPRIVMTYPSLVDLPDDTLVQFAQSVLQSSQWSPLVTSGAIDLRQILESVGVPVSEDLDARLADALELAKETASGGGQPGQQGGNPFGSVGGGMMSLANRLGGNRVVPSREDVVSEALAEFEQLYDQLRAELEALRDGKPDDGTLKSIIAEMRQLNADARIASQVVGMASLFEPELADHPVGPRQQAATLSNARYLDVTGVQDGSPLDSGSFASRIFRFPWVEKVVGFLQSKSVVTPAELRQISRPDRVSTFTVPGIDDLSIVDELKREVSFAAASGESLEEFSERLDDRLTNVGLSPGQTETMYRTNTHQGYVAGQDAALRKPAVKSLFPYVRYVATQDNRVRDEHWDLDGMIAEVDSPLHELFKRALNDWNCRCTLIPMRADHVTDLNTIEDVPGYVRTHYRLSLEQVSQLKLLAQLRSPKGGVTIAGKEYQGGMFIPSEELEKASPEEKEELERKIKEGELSESATKPETVTADDNDLSEVITKQEKALGVQRREKMKEINRLENAITKKNIEIEDGTYAEGSIEERLARAAILNAEETIPLLEDEILDIDRALDDLKEVKSASRGMIRSREQFAQAASELGFSPEDALSGLESGDIDEDSPEGVKLLRFLGKEEEYRDTVQWMIEQSQLRRLANDSGGFHAHVIRLLAKSSTSAKLQVKFTRSTN